jgi:hypothetical protein
LKTGKIAILYSAVAVVFFMAAPTAASGFSDNSGNWQKWSSPDWEYFVLAATEQGPASSELTKIAKRTRAADPKAPKKTEPSTGTEIPEPSNLLMLVLGVFGLIAGRYAAKRRRKKA